MTSHKAIVEFLRACKDAAGEIACERRDSVVQKHIVRLGVVDAMRKPKDADYSCAIVQERDETKLRMFLAFWGRGPRESGLMMVTAPNLPGMRKMLEVLGLGNFTAQPHFENRRFS